jgi:hypothetical protein
MGHSAWEIGGLPDACHNLARLRPLLLRPVQKALVRFWTTLQRSHDGTLTIWRRFRAKAKYEIGRKSEIRRFGARSLRNGEQQEKANEQQKILPTQKPIVKE